MAKPRTPRVIVDAQAYDPRWHYAGPFQRVSLSPICGFGGDKPDRKWVIDPWDGYGARGCKKCIAWQEERLRVYRETENTRLAKKRAENPEWNRERVRRWEAMHPGRAREGRRRTYRNNRESNLARQRAYDQRPENRARKARREKRAREMKRVFALMAKHGIDRTFLSFP